MIQCFKCGAALSNKDIKAEFADGEEIEVTVECPQCKKRSYIFITCADLIEDTDSR